MEAIIRYPDTQRTEVLILSIGRYAMRILPHGADDAIELTLSYGQWTDEAGAPIEFEAYVVTNPDEVGRILGSRSSAATS